MSHSGKKLNTERILLFLLLAVLLAYLAVFGIINFCGFEDICTSDMYEDTLVAKLMWEQKTLFPKNYLFGNQLYVLATPVLAALFFGITGSLNTGMALATTVMTLLILLAMDWMLKPFTGNRVIRLAALLAFVIAVFGPNTITREDGQLFFVMCSFYACYTITYFFVLGDYVRSFGDARTRLPALITALVLCFCMGIQSLRQTCICVLPILCFELLRIVSSRLREGKFPPLRKRTSLIRAMLYLLSNAAGLVTAKMIDVTCNTIYEGASVFNGGSVSEKLSAVHDSLSTVSGFEYIRGENGLFFLIMGLFLTGMVIAAAIMIAAKIKEKPQPTVCLWLISVIAVLAVILSTFVTSVRLRPIYIFIYYVLPALSLVIIIPKLSPRLGNLLVSILIVLAAANIYFSYSVQINSALDKNETSDWKEISEYAVSNGYSYIYGSHSHAAPGVAVWSDGVLIAGCWEDECVFRVSKYINIKDIYHIDDYKKALFVFIEDEAALGQIEADANGTTLTFIGKFGNFDVYTSSAQLLYPISDNIYNAYLFPDYN